MKFILLVEGPTEKALAEFLRTWLDSKLPRRVGVEPKSFGGWNHYYDDVAQKAKLYLSGSTASKVIAVIGLLDLYGLNIFPPNRRTASERYAWAKQHLEDKVGHPRFRQHFAVHETEAWLLAEPSILPREVSTALPGRCSRPEDVNFDEHPSKLLQRLYRSRLKRTYGKVIDGSSLFHKLSPDRAAEKCPALRALLDDLLLLAQDRVS